LGAGCSPARAERTTGTPGPSPITDGTICPVTRSPDPVFIPPAPYASKSPIDGQFWYGSSDLWTLLPAAGTWSALPHDRQGYFQKVLWWRDGYHAETEPKPALTVTGRRLWNPQITFETDAATNGSAGDYGEFMLTEVELPTAGCWELTGHYWGYELSFTIEVDP
jgi:hypothetical protein